MTDSTWEDLTITLPDGETITISVEDGNVVLTIEGLLLPSAGTVVGVIAIPTSRINPLAFGLKAAEQEALRQQREDGRG